MVIKLIQLVAFAVAGSVFSFWLGTAFTDDVDSLVLGAKVIYFMVLIVFGGLGGLGFYIFLFHPELVEKYIEQNK